MYANTVFLFAERKMDNFDRDRVNLAAKSLRHRRLQRLSYTRCVTLNPVLSSGKPGGLEVRSVGFSGQMHGLVLVDDLLPPITSTREITGTVQPPAARETGIPAGTPVIAGGSDQAMAATALQADRPGTVAVAISTGGTVITTVKAPVTDRRIHTFCHVENDSWLTLGATLSAGASLSWFQRILSTGSNQDSGEPTVDFETISRWVSSTSPGADGLFFAPFLNGERTPHMDPDARGCFIGLNLSHTTAHLARAVMEGVVYSLHESFSIFREYQLPIDRVIAYAGGSRSAVWRQILADVIDRPVAWNSATDVSAIGAALLAGHGAGFKPEYSAGSEPELTHPDPRAVALYRERVKVFRRMYQHLSPIFRDITSFQS